MRRRSILPALALASAAPAYAVPPLISHQGRLVDGDGSGLEDPTSVTFSLYRQADALNADWTETAVIDPNQGYYSVILGQFNPFADGLWEQGELFFGIQPAGRTEVRTEWPVASVPYAIVANSAIGGVVDVQEIRIGGEIVIDSTGAYTGPVEGGLTGLDCEPGGVPVFDGTNWTCRIDEVDTYGAAIEAVESEPVALAAGTTIGGSDVATLPVGWFDVGNRPQGLDDGDDDSWGLEVCPPDHHLVSSATGGWTCVDDQFSTRSDVTTYLANTDIRLSPGTDLPWNQLTGVPAAVELAELCSSDGDSLVWEDGAWACVREEIESGADVSTFLETTPITLHGDTDVPWAQITGVPTTQLVPSGMIAMFAGACPTDWSPYAAMNGRVPRGEPTGNPASLDVGGSDDAIVASHQHGSTGLSINPAGGHGHAATSAVANAGAHAHQVSGNTANAGRHRHNVSGNTASAGSHTHPYGDYYWRDTVPSPDIYGTSPGDGRGNRWNIGRTTGASGSHPHSIDINSGYDSPSGHPHAFDVTSAQAAAHSHTATVSVANAAAHAHSVSGTTATAGVSAAGANLPAYAEILFCVKD